MNILGRRTIALSPEKHFVSVEQKKKIKHYLQNLGERNQSLDSLLIATKSGNLLVFSHLNKTGQEKTRLGFMSVSLTELVVSLITSYRKREFIAFTIETKRRIISSSLLEFPRGDILLLCVFSPEVQLGLAQRDFRAHKENLNTILLTDQ
ncbi:MAG: hypothetical protein KTR17_06240 [Cellvibrionaceae bacterium]|nr:hypothetical protein [Cellvibrionaceae bacterium]